MYDYPPRAKRFVGLIINKDLTVSDVSQKVSIPRSSFTRRLANDMDFKRDVVAKIKRTLSLTAEETFYFFFDPNRDDRPVPIRRNVPRVAQHDTSVSEGM